MGAALQQHTAGVHQVPHPMEGALAAVLQCRWDRGVVLSAWKYSRAEPFDSSPASLQSSSFHPQAASQRLRAGVHLANSPEPNPGSQPHGGLPCVAALSAFSESFCTFISAPLVLTLCFSCLAVLRGRMSSRQTVLELVTVLSQKLNQNVQDWLGKCPMLSMCPCCLFC